MTVLLENGVIWTGDPARPWMESMAVTGDRLGEVASAGLAPARRLDLKKAFVCPGLIDAHAHVLGFGRGLTRVDLGGTRSPEEALERVRLHIAAQGRER